MGKKVRKYKNVEIMLEPDGFSIHTIELSCKVSQTEWKQIKSDLYDYNEQYSENIIHPDGLCHGCHICTQYAEAGIRIRLEHIKDKNETKGHCIRMIINPRRLIFMDTTYLGILPNEEESIELLEKCFREVLKKSSFDGDISHYYLSRVDLCTNIRCNHEKVFRELVRMLRKTATPKKYQRLFYQNQDKKKANKYNKHYIRLACGQQELVIYDKTYQLAENNLVIDYEDLPAGVLRVEVHYGRDKLRSIENKYKADDPLDLLWVLMQESEERILQLVEKCYPDLPYLSYEDGQQTIQNSSLHAGTKEQMLTLLDQMQRKQTIDKAVQYMEKKGHKTKSLLKRFQSLGLNPIPLRKGYAAKRMPSLLYILKSVGTQPVKIELAYWKQK